MNWLDFIEKGFQNKKDLEYSKKYLEKNQASDIPKDDELDIFWRKKNGLKEFVVCCLCGNSRMILHENGVRCHSCGRFHSHDSFSKMKIKVTKLAKMGDGKKEILPQPFQQDYLQRYGFGKFNKKQRTKSFGRI